MKARRVLTRPVTVLATVIGIIATGALAAPAHASTGWNLTHTPGDVVGAWGYGSVWLGSNGRLNARVNVEDTKANSRNASVKLHAVYSNADTRNEQLVNNNGSGKTVTYTYNFREDIVSLWAKECIDNSYTTQKCGSWYRIW